MRIDGQLSAETLGSAHLNLTFSCLYQQVLIVVEVRSRPLRLVLMTNKKPQSQWIRKILLSDHLAYSMS